MLALATASELLRSIMILCLTSAMVFPVEMARCQATLVRMFCESFPQIPQLSTAMGINSRFLLLHASVCFISLALSAAAVGYRGSLVDLVMRRGWAVEMTVKCRHVSLPPLKAGRKTSAGQAVVPPIRCLDYAMPGFNSAFCA